MEDFLPKRARAFLQSRLWEQHHRLCQGCSQKMEEEGEGWDKRTTLASTCGISYCAHTKQLHFRVSTNFRSHRPSTTSREGKHNIGNQHATCNNLAYCLQLWIACNIGRNHVGHRPTCFRLCHHWPIMLDTRIGLPGAHAKCKVPIHLNNFRSSMTIHEPC